MGTGSGPGKSPCTPGPLSARVQGGWQTAGVGGALPMALVLGASQSPLGLQAWLGSLPFLPSTYSVPGSHQPAEGVGARKVPTDPFWPPPQPFPQPSQAGGQAPEEKGHSASPVMQRGTSSEEGQVERTGPQGVRLY